MSAGGATEKDIKVTDTLIEAYREISAGKEFNAALSRFYDRVSVLIKSLKINLDFDDLRMKIEQGFNVEPTLDFLLSRGEYVYALVMSLFLGVKFVDSASVMKFNSDGSFNYEYSYFLIEERFLKEEKFVMGGFYGSDVSGKIKVFERGGGDLSGAIVAAAIGAEYENYTDVCGMYSFNPKIIPEAPLIEEISFSNARIMSEFGAGVIHPDSVLPLKGKNLCITIKNTFAPMSERKTVIKERCNNVAFGIAVKQDYAFYELIGVDFGKKIAEEVIKSGVYTLCLSVKKDSVNLLCEERSSGKIKALSFVKSYNALLQVSVAYFTPCEQNVKIIEHLKRRIKPLMFVEDTDGCFFAFETRFYDIFTETVASEMKMIVK